MYGEMSRLDDVRPIRNEVSFTNLIAIANNPEIFEHLDREIQQRLIQVLCGYTKVCIDAILGDYRHEAKMINELVKEAEQKHQRNN